MLPTAGIGNYPGRAEKAVLLVANSQARIAPGKETTRWQLGSFNTPIRPPISPTGRMVIVIDDGLATGATMISALHGLRARKPAKLVCAVPVAPPDTLAKVASLADEVVCLEAPERFQAVGQFYRHFPQVDDDEVIRILKNA